MPMLQVFLLHPLSMILSSHVPPLSLHLAHGKRVEEAKRSGEAERALQNTRVVRMPSERFKSIGVLDS